MKLFQVFVGGLFAAIGANAQRSCHNFNSPGGYSFGSVGQTTYKSLPGTGDTMDVSSAGSTIWATIDYEIQAQADGSGGWTTVHSQRKWPSMAKPTSTVVSGGNSNTNWRLKLTCASGCSRNGIDALHMNYCLNNLLDVGTTADVDFQYYGENCNCHGGTRLDDIGGTMTAQACGEHCKNNPDCESFGIWTQSNANIGGHCGLFRDVCPTSCPDPTSTGSGYLNKVWNLVTASPTASPTPSPSDSPTSSPTTAEQLQVQQMTTAVGSSLWRTSVVGDNMYKCDISTDYCLVNAPGSRHRFVVDSIANAGGLGVNLELTTGDNVEFVITDTAITATTPEGSVFNFPFECACA